MNDRVVIIPTYNEKENIENILRYVFKLEPKFDVLVIEDNSPDGTAQIVKRLQSEFPQLHMIERKGKLGLGTAYITGFKWSLEHGYNYIFEMDADFSHNPDDLVKLYHACESGEGDTWDCGAGQIVDQVQENQMYTFHWQEWQKSRSSQHRKHISKIGRSRHFDVFDHISIGFPTFTYLI